jgi:hypothetical protein
MLCRDIDIANSNFLAENAGQDRRMPASSKTVAKTTTKIV